MFLKKMLDGKNIPFEEKNVSHDESALSYLQGKGISSLPYVETSSDVAFSGVRPDIVKELAKEFEV